MVTCLDRGASSYGSISCLGSPRPLVVVGLGHGMLGSADMEHGLKRRRDATKHAWLITPAAAHNKQLVSRLRTTWLRLLFVMASAPPWDESSHPKVMTLPGVSLKLNT